jgi:hypothetical protein
LNVRAIWQSLDSRVRGNERTGLFLHVLIRENERVSPAIENTMNLQITTVMAGGWCEMWTHCTSFNFTSALICAFGSSREGTGAA